jgi:hypothetical protein
MAIFKIEVTKVKTWVEYCHGTAYIEATSLEQAEKKARRINRAIKKDIYDSAEFNDVEFDEGESVLINTNDFAEGDEEFTTTVKQLHERGKNPHYVDLDVGVIEEVKDTIDKSKITMLHVPDRREF